MILANYLTLDIYCGAASALALLPCLIGCCLNSGLCCRLDLAGCPPYVGIPTGFLLVTDGRLTGLDCVTALLSPEDMAGTGVPA